jgi:hypothetical protein
MFNHFHYFCLIIFHYSLCFSAFISYSTIDWDVHIAKQTPHGLVMQDAPFRVIHRPIGPAPPQGGVGGKGIPIRGGIVSIRDAKTEGAAVNAERK